MSSVTQTIVVASNSTVPLDKFMSKKLGVNGPSVKTIRSNFLTLGETDRTEVMKLLAYTFKSLPPNLATIDGVFNADVAATAASGNADKAPNKQLKTNLERLKKFLPALTANVAADFLRSANFMLALEPELKPGADFILKNGNMEDKQLVQKGFFIFYANNNEALTWLTAMVDIGVSLLDVIVPFLGPPPPGAAKRPPVSSKNERIAAFNGGNPITVVPRPSMTQAQDVWKLVANRSGGTLSGGPMVEIFAIINPGRMMATRENNLGDGKIVNQAYVNAVVAQYKRLNDAWKVVFNLPTKEIPNGNDGKELNAAFKEALSTVRGIIAEFRIRLFGGGNRLGANEKRTIKFSVSL